MHFLACNNYHNINKKRRREKVPMNEQAKQKIMKCHLTSLPMDIDNILFFSVTHRNPMKKRKIKIKSTRNWMNEWSLSKWQFISSMSKLNFFFVLLLLNAAQGYLNVLIKSFSAKPFAYSFSTHSSHSFILCVSVSERKSVCLSNFYPFSEWNSLLFRLVANLIHS